MQMLIERGGCASRSEGRRGNVRNEIRLSLCSQHSILHLLLPCLPTLTYLYSKVYVFILYIRSQLVSGTYVRTYNASSSEEGAKNEVSSAQLSLNREAGSNHFCTAVFVFHVLVRMWYERVRGTYHFRRLDTQRICVIYLIRDDQRH